LESLFYHLLPAETPWLPEEASDSMSDGIHVTPEVGEAFEQAANGLLGMMAVEVTGAKVGILNASRRTWSAAVSMEAATARMAFLAPRWALMRRNWRADSWF
jgi:hypothetical protein